MCADSRFAKPRNSLQRGRFYVLFASCKKNQKARQRFANLWTPGTIQSSVEKNSAKFSGGTCRNRFCLQNADEKALNRCERVTVVQTQDRCFSKKDCCTASSQWQAIFEKGCCTLVLLRWEVEFCSAEMSFFVIGLLCMSRKSLLLRIKNFFISRKRCELHSKLLFYAQKLLLYVPFFAVRKNFTFSQTKSFSFAESFTKCPQKPPFYVQKAFLLHKPFLIAIQSTPFLPSASHSHHP